MKLRNRRADDDDDDDLDLDNRWGMDNTAMQRAEIEEITEEEVVEEVFHDAEELLQGVELSDTEEAFHGFGGEELERALELQAMFGADDEEEASETEGAFHGFELEEVEKALELQAKFGADNDKDATEEVLGSEVSLSRRKNLSPKERRKRKAAAKARSGE